MSSEARDVVSLGADVGGRDAHGATHEHILSLRRLLRQKCKASYSSIIKEFALILRVDGAMQAWGKRGVENVAFQRKRGIVTADIFVSIDEWSSSDASRIRMSLALGVRDAIEKVAEFVQRKKIDLAVDNLRLDVGAAIDEFLA